MKSADRTRWLRFREALEQQRGESYESLLPYPSTLGIWTGGALPRHLFYFTKEYLCRRWVEQGVFPSDWLIIVRSLVPTPETLALVRMTSREFKRPVVFVGDLDPLDLTIFATLRSGSADLAGSTTAAIPVRFAGLNDEWLRLVDRFRQARFSRDPWPMNHWEKRHFQVLDALVPDIETLVGPKSYAVLRAGLKLEVETAGACGGYRKTLPTRLISYLRRLSAEHDD